MHNISANSLFVGQNVINLTECGSTNDILKDLLTKSVLPEGAAVVTDNQTSGRGQQGNAWISEPGKNLTTSVLLKPNFIQVNEQFRINIAVSLAVCETIEQFTNHIPLIKWPNDILVNKQKIAGILIENTLMGNVLSATIAGIGINCNQLNFNDLQHKTTSLALLSDTEVQIEKVASVLFSFIEKYYLALRSGKYHELKMKYLAKLFLYGEKGNFTTQEGEKIEAIISGVAEDGRLALEHNGKLRYFYFKEITLQI